MSKIALITDSTANLPEAIIQQYNITIVPLNVVWGEESFLDGVEITPQQFYERLKTTKVMPSTSQPSPASFKKVYDRLLAEGHEILVSVISSKLSGTFSSATQAAEMLPGAPIEVVDSLSTAMGLGTHIILAARAAEKGASLAECKAIAEKARAQSSIYLTVDTLDFLHRGGRIGSGARFLGTALNIKPIMEVRDGKIEAVEKVRTRSKVLSRMIDLVEASVQGKDQVRLSVIHANVFDEAQAVLEQATARLKPVETFVAPLSPVIGTHTGPGTMGLVYTYGI